MPLGVNSCGFGHGAFGHGAFGHGPWVSFPHQPTLVFDEELSFPVAVTPFEDATEQRLLLSSDRGLTLGYEFSVADSATIGAVGSFFIAAGGPATRFRFTDHRTGIPYIGRFAEQGLTLGRPFGMQRDIPRFGLKVNRYVTFGEDVFADSPVAWWRQNEATGSITTEDASGNLHAGLVVGTFTSVTGLLTGDADTAVSLNGASGIIATDAPGDVSGTNPFTLEAVFRPSTAPAAAFLVARCGTTGLNGAALAWAGAKARFTRGNGSALDTITSLPLALGETHHAVATYDGTTMRLYVNGALVAEAASSKSSNPAGLLTSMGVDQAGTGSFFTGTLDDCAIYNATLSATRVLRHFQAATRP